MDFFYAIAAAVAISLISLIAILVVPRKWDHSMEQRLLGFAVGVMLTTATLHLLPEAVEATAGHGAYYALLAGIIGFLFLERLFRGFHSHQQGSRKAPGYLVIVGDGLHNFIDGLAIGVAFQVSPTLGVVTTVAIAAHEIPQEIADFVVLRKAGFSRQRALLVNAASAFMALLGTVLTFGFGDFFHAYEGLALALTAGIFLYIAAADIIPELNHEHTAGNKFALPMVLGVLVIIALTMVVPEHQDTSQPEAASRSAQAIIGP